MQEQEKPINLSPSKLLTFALRFFEWVYPPAAVKMAKKFFFTPLRFTRPEREFKSAEQAQKQELMLGKKRITVYSWGKGDKKILLVHGWAGRATQFFKVKNFLLSRGFQVVAFDAPAHGDNTDVEQTHMLEFVDSIERVNMTFGPFYGAVGHSLGGLAILNAYNKGFKVDKIAVVAAPCSIGNIVRDFTRRIGAGERTEKGLIAHLIATYEVPLEHYSGGEQSPTIKANGLIVHDVHDHDVSVEEGRALHKAWKGSKLHVTKRLGHRRILLDKDAVVTIADFFGRRKPGRPPRKSSGTPARLSNTSPSDDKESTGRPAPRRASKPTTTTEASADKLPAKQQRRRPPRKPRTTDSSKESTPSSAKDKPTSESRHAKATTRDNSAPHKGRASSSSKETPHSPTKDSSSANKKVEPNKGKTAPSPKDKPKSSANEKAAAPSKSMPRSKDGDSSSQKDGSNPSPRKSAGSHPKPTNEDAASNAKPRTSNSRKDNSVESGQKPKRTPTQKKPSDSKPSKEDNG